METGREKGNSLGVPHQRAGARSRADEAAIRLIVSRSPPPFQTERQSENSRGGVGGGGGQHLTRVTKAEMKCGDKKKKSSIKGCRL